MEVKTGTSVADILEREQEPAKKEWLRRVNMVPDVTAIPLSDADRTSHLPELFDDVIWRLRIAPDEPQRISFAARAR